MSLFKDFNQGIIKENPVLRLMIGLCPVLAVSNNAVNAAGMSAAVMFVLVGSNWVVALIARWCRTRSASPFSLSSFPLL